MVQSPDWDTYMGETVEESGKPIGTVVDFDTEEGVFYLEPSGEVDANTWDALGWGMRADYDAGWRDVDYESWRAGESDVTVEADEWPFTLPGDALEAGEDGLEYVG